MSFTPTKISDDFSSAPQIAPEDVAEIAKQGYKTIMNCRPDGEGGAEQPTGASIQAEAERFGLRFLHFPVAMGTAGDEFREAAAKALAETPKPVLGYCRSGTRAGKLYQAASTGGGGKQSPLQWLKSKCLITRFWRWCKNKRCAGQCAVKQ